MKWNLIRIRNWFSDFDDNGLGSYGWFETICENNRKGLGFKVQDHNE